MIIKSVYLYIIIELILQIEHVHPPGDEKVSVSFENINLKNNNNTAHVIPNTTELYNPLYIIYSFIVYALNRFDFRSARLYDFGVVIFFNTTHCVRS